MQPLRHYTLPLLLLCGLLLTAGSCKRSGGGETPDPPTPPEPTPEEFAEGISYDPAKPDADSPLTITFAAPLGNALYGYSGEVYAHIGLIDGGEWQYVPADWGTNLEKCRFTKVQDNVWQLTLSPTIREWFGAKEGFPVTKIGLVIRSSDGKIKAYSEDQFISVKDASIKPLPKPVVKSLDPSIPEGITRSEDKVTLALCDLSRSGSSPYVAAYLLTEASGWQRDEDYAMYRDEERGLWWITLPLPSGEELAFQYQLYRADGSTLRIADPYSELLLFESDREISRATYPDLPAYPDTYGAVTLVSESDYSWQHDSYDRPDELLIYELHLRDYSTTGDLRGALADLDRIADMGFTAIELMPVQEFSGNDSWGYNPIYYFALDKAYGRRDDYKAFVDACHERGLSVILDVVYNHMDSPSPLVQLYAEGGQPTADNPYFNRKAPHPYSVFCDFDHSSSRTRDLVKRNLRFLLQEYHVDGFRFDLSKGITQKPSSEATAGQYDADRIAILSDYYDAIREVSPDAVMILEHFAEQREEQALADKGMMLWQNLNNAFCQTAMGYKEDSSLAPLYEKKPLHWVAYMESHDEERMAYKQSQWGVASIQGKLGPSCERLALNAAFFLLAPGPKMVWQYGEVGYDVSIEENGRTGRKPVWSDEQKSVPERAALQASYSSLLQFRSDHPGFFDGIGDTVEAKVGLTQWGQRTVTITDETGRRLYLVGNFDPLTSITVTLPSGSWDDALTPEEESLGGSPLTIAPGHFRLLTDL